MSGRTTPIRLIESPKPTLAVDGDLDFRVSVEFVEAGKLMLHKHKSLSVDLRKVGYIDSSGLGALLSARRLADGANSHMELFGLGPCVHRALQVSGLASTFGMQPWRMDAARKPLMSDVELRRAEWQVYESVVVGRPTLIAGLRDSATEMAVESGMSEVAVCDVKLAVGEALANALRHGLQPGRDKIRLRCLYCRCAFVVEVIDQGRGFDPDSVVPPEPQEMQPGGLGIRLMRSTMDQVDFMFDGHGSKVRLLKWISPQQEIGL